jgi:hypothetical protein
VLNLADDLADVSESVSLRDELEATPPGVALHTVLAGVDRSGLDAGELLRLAMARQRLIAHQEAQLLADLHAVARTVPEQDVPLPDRISRRAGKYPWAEVEAAFAFRWTQGRAVGQFILADEVIDRLPQLFAALDAGVIDVPKALVVVELLGCVDDALAVALVDRIIEQASALTTGELRARLRRLLIAADPQAAAKKARQGITERRVAAYPNDDNHLATLAGYELAPHRVGAVMERLDAIAKATKASGDERSMDQLRADAFLDLLSGEGIAAGGLVTDGALGLSSPEPDTAAATEQLPWPQAPPDPPADLEPETEPESEPPVDPEGVVELWAFGFDPPPAAQPHPHEQLSWQEVNEQRRWLADFDRLSAIRPATLCVLCGQVEGTPGGGPLPGPRPGSVDIVVSLDTLLGLSQAPAEISGIGPVVAEVARQVIAETPDTRRRFSVYNQMRELAYHGSGAGGYTPDRLRQGGHARARSPNARLAAFIQARDRTCVAPGCRRPARRCDIDHSLDWVKGGQTVHCNLELLCRLCRARHNRHYAEHRIMPRRRLRVLWCKSFLVRNAA